VGAKSGQKKSSSAAARSKATGFKRLALVVFAAIFVALFAIFAVAQGIGEPSVPSGDVAIVKGISEGNVSEAELKRAVVQQIASQGIKKAPGEGSKKFEELRDAALGELLNGIWVRGEAEELGIEVTDKQIETELATIKKQNFPTPKAYNEFLETSKFTQDDVDVRVELQVLSQEIQERISAESKPPSSSEIAAYYDSVKASQFTEPATRDVRVIVNKDESKVEEAKKELEKDDSAASWKTVAPKFSSDPTTKTKGGLQKAIPEELLSGALRKAVFESATGELVGPVEFQKNFLLVEVEKLNPKKVKTLAEVKSQISTQLAQEKQQEVFSEFVGGFQSKWTSRTFCSSDVATAQCSNFKGTGHPAGAPEACYEADPKTPTTECPAPVEQTKPALPGTVSVSKPQGERLVQRPRPEVARPSAGSNPAEALEEAASEAGE
jgi:parvulin-like peptidyl-prolyl isomerase